MLVCWGLAFICALYAVLIQCWVQTAFRITKTWKPMLYIWWGTLIFLGSLADSDLCWFKVSVIASSPDVYGCSLRSAFFIPFLFTLFIYRCNLPYNDLNAALGYSQIIFFEKFVNSKNNPWWRIAFVLACCASFVLKDSMHLLLLNG